MQPFKIIDDMKYGISGVIIKRDHTDITYEARYYIVMQGVTSDYPKAIIHGALHDTQI